MRAVFIGREEEVFFVSSAGMDVMTFERAEDFKEHLNSMKDQRDMMYFVTEEFCSFLGMDMINKLSLKNITITTIESPEMGFGFSGEMLFEKISRAVGINVRNL